MLQLLRQVESDLSDEHSAENAALACECATIRSVTIALGDDSQGALSLAEDCLNRTNDPWTANVASNVARFGYLKAGDLTRFWPTSPYLSRDGYLRAGDRSDAVAAFRQVLNVGSQVGLYQSFLDQGPEIGPMLLSVRDDAAHTGSAADFICYLDRLVEGYTARSQAQVKGIPNPAIAEPLSGREGDILNLIAQGRSDKEIARILSIAPETVKSHVKHIFSKLQVRKRAQAVSRAQDLGLV